MLRGLGHEVFSPAENDIKVAGKDVSKSNADGSAEQATKEHGFSLRKALGDDLAWICAEAEGLALLPGWESSKGALAELATAEALGLKVFYIVEGRLVSEADLIDWSWGVPPGTAVAPAIPNFDTVR
jgi:hypothetical protein